MTSGHRASFSLLLPSGLRRSRLAGGGTIGRLDRDIGIGVWCAEASVAWADLLLPQEVAARQFEKWKEAADKDKERKGAATYTYTRVEFEKKAFWVADAHYGDGVAYKSIGVYAPEKDGSFRRVLVTDSNMAGWLGVEFDPKTGVLELREKANSSLKGTVILSCNLRSVGTAYSTGVTP